MARRRQSAKDQKTAVAASTHAQAAPTQIGEGLRSHSAAKMPSANTIGTHARSK
jgi:hypothetical protein